MTDSTSAATTSAAARLFGKVVRIGVAVNLSFAVPAVFFPAFVLGLFKLDPGDQDIWARFAATLLVLLSLFYLPAAKDPLQSVTASVLTVFSRAAGVAFFAAAVFVVGESARLLALCGIDLFFGAVEGVFLWKAFKERQAARERLG